MLGERWLPLQFCQSFRPAGQRVQQRLVGFGFEIDFTGGKRAFQWAGGTGADQGEWRGVMPSAVLGGGQPDAAPAEQIAAELLVGGEIAHGFFQRRIADLVVYRSGLAGKCKMVKIFRVVGGGNEVQLGGTHFHRNIGVIQQFPSIIKVFVQQVIAILLADLVEARRDHWISGEIMGATVFELLQQGQCLLEFIR